jgi:hypothetical protein
VFRGSDAAIRDTVARLDVAPNQWSIGTIRYPTSFAVPIGANAWQAAFEALQRDAATPLPEDG